MKSKNSILKTFSFLYFSLSVILNPLAAQTGPAGVGNSSTIEIWLDASQLDLTNNDAVSSFTDFSGNNNHAEQATSNFRPIYKTNQINGRPVIEFDGSNDRMDFLSNITNFETTTYIVFNSNVDILNILLTTQNHILSTQDERARLSYNNFSQIVSNRFTNTQNSFVWYKSGSGASNVLTSFFSKSSATSFTRQASINRPSSHLGAYYTNGNFHNHFFEGQMAEVIIFNEDHNPVQQRIIRNYLNSKYDLNQLPNLYDFASTHPSEVIGIGNESSGGNFTARGSGAIQISNASSLDNGDYLLIGHNDAGFATSTSVSPNYIERWSQVWRTDLTNTPGTIDIEFFLGTNDFADNSDYVILIDTDGDFTNGSTAHSAGLSYNVSNNSISFTGVDLPDGSYFTLAEKSNAATAIADGNWEDASTWACNCIPTPSLDVTIPATFDVTINELANAKSLIIASGGSLIIGGNDTLQIVEGFTINGTFTSGTGTLIGNGTLSQTFANTSGNVVTLNNLVANNSSSLFLTGGWTLSNNLHISSGTLDVTSADSLVLTSDATKTAQILESAGTINGDLILQRYISTRNSGFGNISSPITSATVASIDDDLKLSGVNGNNGNAVDQNGGTFYSMYSYDRSNNNKVDTITSTTTALEPGIGYEVYLFNTLATMNDTVIDYVGTPNLGNVSPANLLTGFNLAGNPYQSFIAFDNLDQSNIGSTYYIYETDNGSYGAYGSGDVIAPGQGFWVDNTSGGSASFNFEESDKISSNSSTFLRQKKSTSFSLELSNDVNYFKNTVQIAFDYSATEGLDQLDARFLPSPHKNASELYSKTIYSDKLIKNTLNQFEESHLIPLELKVGEAGTYQIESKNLNYLLENYSCVYLNDNENNENIDLSVTKNYSFTAESGISNRFNLVLSNSFEDCEEKLNLESINQKIDSKLELRESYGSWFLDYKLENSNQLFKISVYSLNGQLVIPSTEISISGNGTHQLQGMDKLDGIFVIQIIGQEEIINKTIKL